MLKSMTGYGRGENQANGKSFSVEMRSVNHRFLEVFIRVPKYYVALEDRIRKQVQERASRGRIDVFVNVDELEDTNKSIRVDKGLATAYYNALKDLSETIGVTGNIGIMDVARFPDVVNLLDVQEDLEAIWPTLEKAVQRALDQLVDMRQTEGERLKQDLLKRVNKLEDYATQIFEKAPLVAEEYREKLSTRMTEILSGIEIDENRLLTEVAFFADRSNITEELVRLRSHFTEMRKTLENVDSVGRKLDFLVQELNREFNTIGSKSNNLQISSLVVSAKSEVEKIREQVQNLE